MNAVFLGMDPIFTQKVPCPKALFGAWVRGHGGIGHGPPAEGCFQCGKEVAEQPARAAQPRSPLQVFSRSQNHTQPSVFYSVITVGVDVHLWVTSVPTSS